MWMVRMKQIPALNAPKGAGMRMGSEAATHIFRRDGYDSGGGRKRSDWLGKAHMAACIPLLVSNVTWKSGQELVQRS